MGQDHEPSTCILWESKWFYMVLQGRSLPGCHLPRSHYCKRRPYPISQVWITQSMPLPSPDSIPKLQRITESILSCHCYYLDYNLSLVLSQTRSIVHLNFEHNWAVIGTKKNVRSHWELPPKKWIIIPMWCHLKVMEIMTSHWGIVCWEIQFENPLYPIVNVPNYFVS
jgi:hypothetical protein